LDYNPGVLDVVEVVMKYSKLEFLPHLKGIMDDALRQLSISHKKNTYSFLKIFYKFIICIKMLMKSNTQDTDVIKKEDTHNTPSEIVILSLLEYCNAKKINEKIESEEINIEEIKLNANAPNIDPLEETNEDYSELDIEGNKKSINYCLYI